MISVICVYNDRTKLDALLLESLRHQSVTCDLLCIDNTDGRHGCAATVLNEAGCAAANDVVMFVHQDIELLSPTWLADAERIVRTLPTGAAAGVAGVDERGTAWASVWHGASRRFAGGSAVAAPTPVQTLDGCLLLVARADFGNTQFDAGTCRGWHLYVADYCLSRRQRGYGAFVLPLPVYHESTGPPQTRVVRDTADALVEKHRAHAPRIFTTIGELTHRSLAARFSDRIQRVRQRLPVIPC